MAQTIKRFGVRLWAGVLLLAVIAPVFSGCASVQRKFTRKKAQPKHVAQAIAVESGPYQKKFSNDYYYKTHYTYWKAWHAEWVDGLAGNRKRTARNAEETISHLDEMLAYLKPEKAQGLQEAITELKAIQSRMGTGQYSSWGSIKVDLEKWRRVISSGYSIDSVRADLIPDTVDLGEAAVK